MENKKNIIYIYNIFSKTWESPRAIPVQPKKVRYSKNYTMNPSWYEAGHEPVHVYISSHDLSLLWKTEALTKVVGLEDPTQELFLVDATWCVDVNFLRKSKGGDERRRKHTEATGKNLSLPDRTQNTPQESTNHPLSSLNALDRRFLLNKFCESNESHLKSAKLVNYKANALPTAAENRQKSDRLSSVESSGKEFAKGLGSGKGFTSWKCKNMQDRPENKTKKLSKL